MRKSGLLPPPRAKLPVVKVDLEDLLEVEDLLRANGVHELNLYSPVPGYEFDGLADLANSPVEKVGWIEFWCEDGPLYFHLDIGLAGVDISANTNVPEKLSRETARGVVAHIEASLRQRQRGWIARRLLRRKSVVLLRLRGEATPTFLQRRGDDVILSLISAGVGGVIGFVLGLLASVVTD